MAGNGVSRWAASGPSPMAAHLGSAVMLRDAEDGRIESFRLVREGEDAPGSGLLSVASPLGAVLLGREEGDTFSVPTAKGARVFEIIEVENLSQVS